MPPKRRRLFTSFPSDFLAHNFCIFQSSDLYLLLTNSKRWRQAGRYHMAPLPAFATFELSFRCHFLRVYLGRLECAISSFNPAKNIQFVLESKFSSKYFDSENWALAECDSSLVK